ncbi:MAG: peptidase C39 family protein [Candidatus Woesearchaeota archaeon]|nr:peptidase C39 family protein [Candidatus Woesearchaeota archaeon]
MLHTESIPFWKQTTSFTCDPAVLLMALKAFDSQIKLSREAEFEIWRESYGIGIPGCLPQGLAYSALLRGFGATVICPEKEICSVGTLVNGEDAELSVWSAQDLLKKALQKGMTQVNKKPTIQDLSNAIKEGAIPLVMINMRRLHNIDSPHWITVSEVTACEVIFHDPFVETGANTKTSYELFNHLMSDLEEKQFCPRAVIIAKSRS